MAYAISLPSALMPSTKQTLTCLWRVQAGIEAKAASEIRGRWIVRYAHLTISSWLFCTLVATEPRKLLWLVTALLPSSPASTRALIV